MGLRGGRGTSARDPPCPFVAALAETDSDSDDELPPLPEAPPEPVRPLSLKRAQGSPLTQSLPSRQDFGENGTSFLTSVAEKAEPRPRPVTASRKEVAMVPIDIPERLTLYPFPLPQAARQAALEKEVPTTTLLLTLRTHTDPAQTAIGFLSRRPLPRLTLPWRR